MNILKINQSFVVLLSMAAVVACSDNGSTAHTPPDCTRDKDCETGEVCDDGRCIADEPNDTNTAGDGDTDTDTDVDTDVDTDTDNDTDTDSDTDTDMDADADADADADVDADSDPAETDSCANLDLTLDRQPPTIMLVIDQSATMDQPMGDNDTRWSVLHRALMGTLSDPESGLVWRLDDDANFGVLLFTAMRNVPDTCPLIESVSPAPNNASNIAKVFTHDVTYKGASPVPEGIEAAMNLLLAMEKPGKQVILLATDGLPDTCDTLAERQGEAESIAMIQQAHENNIETFVLGVGDWADTEVVAFLQKLANAGAGLDPEGTEQATFYQGATENSLIDAVSGLLIEETISCIYALDGKAVKASDVEKGEVLLDGTPLEYDNPTRGWRMTSPSEIELLGEACTDIQMGEHRLEAAFDCASIILV